MQALKHGFMIILRKLPLLFTFLLFHPVLRSEQSTYMEYWNALLVVCVGYHIVTTIAPFCDNIRDIFKLKRDSDGG